MATRLPLAQQEMLVEIIRRRGIEARRNEIAVDAEKSLAAYRAGELMPQSAAAIIRELHQTLDIGIHDEVY